MNSNGEEAFFKMAPMVVFVNGRNSRKKYIEHTSPAELP